MVIDFSSEVAKRDKLNKLCDFCLEFVPDNLEELYNQFLQNPCFHGKVRYTDEERNQIVTIRVYPGRDNGVNINFHSASLDDSPIYRSFSAHIYAKKDLVFLSGSQGNVMRNAEGKLLEMIGWIDVETNMAETLPEVLPSTRKQFEELYDRFYTEDIPKVVFPDLGAGAKEIINAIKNGISDVEKKHLKDSLTLLKPDEELPAEPIKKK